MPFQAENSLEEIPMLTWREYIALLLAGVWDSTQVALVATIGGLLSSSFSFADEVANNLPILVLCSVSVFILSY